MNIVRADAFDFSAVAGALLKMADEGAIEFDLKYASESLINIINDGAVYMAVDDNNNICGVIGLYARPDLWHPRPIVYEKFFFVLKEYRNTTAGEDLLKHANQVAADHGEKLIVGHKYWQKDRMEVADKYFESCGFEKIGTFFEGGAK